MSNLPDQLDVSLRPALRELERIYLAVAKENVDGEFVVLSEHHPVITVQTKGRRKELAHCSFSRWQTDDGIYHNELNLSAEDLCQPVYDIAERLVHEMAHHANALLGLEDTTKAQYHNQQFQTAAVRLGLDVERDGRNGWSRTILDAPLKEVVDSMGIDQAAFRLARVALEKRQVQRNRTRVWICECGYKLRAAEGLELSLTCNVCGTELKTQGGKR